ncbi:2og-Fe oxygenase family protein [Grosmannia clavigera kw1407]|uniref:2og-Fe oxygenase family protein n=1 Tax=Grosmannia clavigera (strain kw1407 / UAMH 11150) TaxID=655863 RepID=F0XAJ1_GROCL|nr:2og-Fe oxygenase family protein [Grosmannia clavigera kw1407]EFX05378.1 2og-Fe oxygenase family protein [Grosmannia clavigera kw1407]
MSFTSIPILDLSRSRNPDTKPAFLAELRDALIEVGFFYIKNVGIPDELFRRVIEQGRAFFDIPEEEKLKIEMKNAPSFLGYSRLSAEITAGAADHREQIDLSTEHAEPVPDAPRYEHLLAPNQWPSAAVLPDFRPAFSEFLDRMGAMSLDFTALMAEAIGLPATAFDRYFDPDPARRQHKLKVVKYPDEAELGVGNGDGSSQGVGPHKDSMYTTFLLQASAHHGLQAQNTHGQWVDAPPIDGTLVVVIGQGIEALTQGVCVSTTHRVVSPPAGAGARFSIPFFQGVRLDTAFEELERVGIGAVPEPVKDQRRAVLAAAAAANGGRLDDVEFTFRTGGAAKTLGEATLRNRVKSHPDVGERWFPDILADIRAEERQQQRKKGDGEAVRPGETSSAVGAAVAVPAH